jgi:hypothetical protein
VTFGMRRSAPVVAVLLALALLLGGQALGDSVAAGESGVATGSAAGRAGFAYLTGLRVFAADLIWNRLDPLGDRYYGHGLSKYRFMIPNILVITWLDPQFIDAYYVGPEILAEDRETTRALAMAREGIANNPRSGELMGSIAELLIAHTKQYELAASYADRAMRTDTLWRNDDEHYDSLAIFAVAYKLAGMPEKAAEASRQQKALGAKPGFTSQPAGQ